MSGNQPQVITKKRIFFSFLLQFFGLGLVYGGSRHWSKWLYVFISISILVLIFLLFTRFNEVYIANTTLLNVSLNCLYMLVYPMILFDPIFSSALPIISHFIGITYWLIGFLDLTCLFFKKDLKEIRIIYLSILILASVLWFLKISSYDNEIGVYREGLTNVSKKGKHGFINRIGKEVIPLQYDYAYNFYEGLAHIAKNNKHGFIDKIGKEVISLKYDDAHNFSDGLVAVRNGKLWGFTDRRGKEVIACQYSYDDYINYKFYFSKGLAEVTKNGKTFTINKKGKCVKDCPK